MPPSLVAQKVQELLGLEAARGIGILHGNDPGPSAVAQAVAAVGAARSDACAAVGKLAPKAAVVGGRNVTIHMVDEPVAVGTKYHCRLMVREGVKHLGINGALNQHFIINRPPVQTVIGPDKVEDAGVAIAEAVEQAVRTVGLTDEITEGKGHTVLVDYAAAGNSTGTTVDGRTYRQATGNTEPFATIRAGAGTDAQPSIDNSAICGLWASTTTDEFQYLSRFHTTHDTSAIGSKEVISAIYSIYGTLKTTTLGSQDFHVVSATMTNNDAVVPGDYTGLGTTSFASITHAAWSAAGFNDLTLNASGLAALNGFGITALGMRGSWDLNNSFGGTWSSSAQSSINARQADYAGSVNDPRLTVTFKTSGAELSTTNPDSGFGAAAADAAMFWASTEGGGPSDPSSDFSAIWPASTATITPVAALNQMGDGGGNVNTLQCRVAGSATANKFSVGSWMLLCFDTSAIPTDATINAVSLRVIGANGYGDNLTMTPLIVVVAATPADPATPVDTDFKNVAATTLASITWANFIQDSDNVFDLGTSGVTQGGVTKLGIMFDDQRTGTFGGVHANASTWFEIWSAEKSGSEPTLYVDYTEASGASGSTMLSMISGITKGLYR